MHAETGREGLRFEQPGYSAPDEPEELAHRVDYQPIRGMT
jgi:hypothetical protein